MALRRPRRAPHGGYLHRCTYEPLEQRQLLTVAQAGGIARWFDSISAVHPITDALVEIRKVGVATPLASAITDGSGNVPATNFSFNANDVVFARVYARSAAVDVKNASGFDTRYVDSDPITLTGAEMTVTFDPTATGATD